MNDPFKCENCGAPRSYINQYCWHCGSSGPHIPAAGRTQRTRLPKRKADSDKPWWNDVEPFEKTPVRKHREPQEKESRWSPPKERKADRLTADEKDMRSLWAGEAPAKKTGIKITRSWIYAALTAVAVLAIAVIAVNIFPVIQTGIESSEIKPEPVAATTPANATDSQPDTEGTQSQNNPQVPAANTTANKPAAKPEPVGDTKAPGLVGKPSAQPGDTTATIAWETDEKATSQVKYGPDISYPYYSTEISKTDTKHSIYVTGLTPETTYHFQVISSDGSGNTLTSGDYTFKTESVTDAGPYMGSKAPDFTLKDLEGREVSLSQFRGKKVVLNFWASWCTPCKVELPHLQGAWEKLKDNGDFVLVTVAGSQSEEALIRSHIAGNGYTFMVLLDPYDSVFNRYQIVSIPRTFFIDKGGVIRRIQQGMFTSQGEVEFMLSSY